MEESTRTAYQEVIAELKDRLSKVVTTIEVLEGLQAEESAKVNPPAAGASRLPAVSHPFQAWPHDATRCGYFTGIGFCDRAREHAVHGYTGA